MTNSEQRSSATPAMVLLAHVSLALARYARAGQVNGDAVPAELLEIAEVLANGVRRGQKETIVGHGIDPGEAVTMDIDPLLLTRAEAASLLRLSAKTLDRLVANGHIPVVKMGHSTRFRRADLDAYVASLAAASTFRSRVQSKDTAR